MPRWFVRTVAILTAALRKLGPVRVTTPLPNQTRHPLECSHKSCTNSRRAFGPAQGQSIASKIPQPFMVHSFFSVECALSGSGFEARLGPHGRSHSRTVR